MNKERFSDRTAKYWSIKIWTYFRDHPNYHDKRLLPQEIQTYRGHVLHEQLNRCPLCTLFYPKGYRGMKCKGCPLYEAGEGCIERPNAVYNLWLEANFGDSPEGGMDVENHRKAAAGKIVDIIKAWEV